MHARPLILIVEDEPAIADTLMYALKTEGFAPEWCSTGRAGLAALAAKPFALVVLDVGLPDGSGFDVCKQIRAQSPVPVIFLTARNAELDRVLGLELGGGDYLVKPFSPRELTARVKAILRRTSAATARCQAAIVIHWMTIARAAVANSRWTMSAARRCFAAWRLC